MLEFVIATNNAHKLREMSAILDTEHRRVLSMKEAGIATDPEETGACARMSASAPRIDRPRASVKRTAPGNAHSFSAGPSDVCQLRKVVNASCVC